MIQNRRLSLAAFLLVLLLPAVAASEPCEEPCLSAFSTCRSLAIAKYQRCLSESCADEQALVQVNCVLPFSPGCRIARQRLLLCRMGCTEGLINDQAQCIGGFFACQSGTVCPPTRTATRTRTPTHTLPPPVAIPSSTPTQTPTPTNTPPRIAG